jgi:EAL domain-containing protein (putative c-di-GMP-specific phosphodiesterase class I)/sensor domain CHASE-containing protein
MALVLLGSAHGSALAVDARASGNDEAVSVERSLVALREAWRSDLDELAVAARGFAVADDTFEFVVRPNLPYIYARYPRERLAAAHIDAVLIVNRAREALFWRRVRGSGNAGFSDAHVFLAGLPALRAHGDTGIPSLSGAVKTPFGLALVVAMPIYPTSLSGASRGWVIVARTLDAVRWRHYEEVAHVTAGVIDPAVSQGDRDVRAAVTQPLEPVVRVAANRVRGLLALTDVDGHAFRVFSVDVARRSVAVLPMPSPSAPTGEVWRFGVLAMATLGLAGAPVVFFRRQSRGVARTGSAGDAADVRRNAGEVTPDVGRLNNHMNQLIPGDGEAEDSASDSRAPVVVPVSVVAAAAESPSPGSAGAVGAWDWLPAALSSRVPLLRYQPQVDLITGRVAGVEALMVLDRPGDCGQATEAVARFEAAGLGLSIVERWLRDACMDRRQWRRHIGNDFPVGVPVSRQTLEDPAFIPMLRRVLADCDLPASFLELELPETVLNGSAAAERVLAELRDVGTPLAIERFTAAQSTLRSLALAPIAKLRLDPALVLEVGSGSQVERLFDGIVASAGALGLIVCATGVDSGALLAAAERHGCQLAQGATAGPTLDADRFLALVRGSGVDTASLPVLQLDEAECQLAESELA